MTLNLGPGWKPDKRPSDPVREVDDEIRFHVEGRIQELMQQGMSQAEAEEQVRRRFGSVTAVRARCEAIKTHRGQAGQKGDVVRTFRQDLMYAFRTLRRNPTYALVAILTLGVGVGATTAIFSVANAVLWRGLPFPDADRLVMVWLDNRVQGFHEDLTSYPNYRDLREGNHTLQALAAYRPRGASLTGSGNPERVRAVEVSAEFFDVMRIVPIIGRVLQSGDDVAGAPIAVISNALWQQRYGGSPGVLGSSLELDGVGHEIVGVVPTDVRYPDETDVWIPLAATGALSEARQSLWLRTIGRLQDGVTLTQARSDLEDVMVRVESEYLNTSGEIGATVNLLHDQIVGDVSSAIRLFVWAGVLVLLIACANIANLILARAASRSSELALRTALGAGRGRLTLQFMTESIALGAFGAPLGVLVAFLSLGVLKAIAPADLPRLDGVGVDMTLLGLAMMITATAVVVFSVLPVMQLGGKLLHWQLRDGATATLGGRRRFVRSALVSAEIALATVLLVGSGLLTKSFAKLQRVEVGFDVDNLLTLQVTLPPSRYQDGGSVREGFRSLAAAFGAVPGVQSVGLGSSILVSEYPSSGTFNIDGRPPFEDDEAIEVLVDPIDPGYLETLGIRLVRGRGFTPSDDAEQPLVAIINEAMASRFWPDRNPVGDRITFGPPTADANWFTVVGVSTNIKQSGLDAAVRPGVYLSFAQVPRRTMLAVMRVGSESLDIGSALRSAMWNVDADLPVTRMASMHELMAERVAQRRFNLMLALIFAGIAVVLAGGGVYGVMAFTVAMSMRELGLRLALGAKHLDVARLVVWRGIVLTAIGLAVGVVGALAVGQSMAGLLFEVGWVDPGVIVATMLGLGFVSVLACLVPAARAMRADAVVALRGD